MRKWFIGIGLALVFVIVAIFLFIPSRLIISEVAVVNCSMPAAKRFLFEQNNLAAWINMDSLNRAGSKLEVVNTFFTKTDLLISTDNRHYSTTVRLLPFNVDSTGLEWGDTLYTGNNPLNRISRYGEAKALKTKMSLLMKQLTSFLNDKSKIYSITVVREQLKDIPLLSKRVVMNRMPTAKDAYDLIAIVHQQARLQGDSAVGAAMKYTSTIDSTSFELMVAVPTSRMLHTNGEVMAKGLVGGNLIATEVHGGEWTIARAWDNIRQYKADYRISSPAIPFELMITDRTKEPDTSKWITKIYYPTRQ